MCETSVNNEDENNLKLEHKMLEKKLNYTAPSSSHLFTTWHSTQSNWECTRLAYKAISTYNGLSPSSQESKR